MIRTQSDALTAQEWVNKNLPGFSDEAKATVMAAMIQAGMQEWLWSNIGMNGVVDVRIGDSAPISINLKDLSK